MSKKLRGSVVVITGASSGIGRAAAQEFAKCGATLVLAARDAQGLREAVAECESLGARALGVVLDVTQPQAVQQVARRTFETFGRLDVWVNDAAVTLFARFDEAPYEDFRRVIETNLFGYIHGARAVLPTFREQGHGVLIDVASIDGVVTQPYMSAYDIAKHGVRALDQCLRQELHLEKQRHIHVCTVLPATIDTPLFQKAANYTGRASQAMPPVYSPFEVARTIVQLAENPERERYVGRMGLMLNLMRRVSPGTTERMMAMQSDKMQLSTTQSAPQSDGNLFQPQPALNAVEGGWRKSGGRVIRRIAAGAAALGSVALAWTWLQPRLRTMPQLLAASKPSKPRHWWERTAA